MSWLSRVRSGIPFLPKRQTAENLWHKCSKCGTMVFLKEWEENYSVCPRCDFHDRIGPKVRLEQLFDAAKYDPPRTRGSRGPAAFPRHQALHGPPQIRAHRNQRARCAGQCARPARRTRRGHRVQDFAFMGGSMGIAVGAAFVAGVRAAIERQGAVYPVHRRAARECRKRS